MSLAGLFRNADPDRAPAVRGAPFADRPEPPFEARRGDHERRRLRPRLVRRGRRGGVFRSVEPAWNDQNLRELAANVRSPLVFAHIRASSGAPVQQTNCHPFRHGRFLWMHNGLIHDFHLIKRDLLFEVDPGLFPVIGGTTDSETLFFLALTFGSRTTRRRRSLGRSASSRTSGAAWCRASVPGDDRDDGRHPALAFRYSSEGASRSSTTAATSRSSVSSIRITHSWMGSRRVALVVSEPLGDLPASGRGAGVTYGVIQPGDDEMHPFVPLAPVG